MQSDYTIIAKLILRASKKVNGRHIARPRLRFPLTSDRVHSITSSAVVSSVEGISKPIALAVFWLITSSNLVGN